MRSSSPPFLQQGLQERNSGIQDEHEKPCTALRTQGQSMGLLDEAVLDQIVHHAQPQEP